MNTVYVAVWNSLMSPASDKTKREVYQAWLEWFAKQATAAKAPWMVVLVEASPQMAADDSTLGYRCIGHVDTQSKDGGLGSQPIAKSLVALWHGGTSNVQCSSGTTLRFPSLDGAIRAAMKVNLTVAGNTATLWFIHANASLKGGTAMVEAVDKELSSSAKTAVIGDYNCDFFEKMHIQSTGVAPTSHQGKTLPFTNWNCKNGSPNTAADYNNWAVTMPRGVPTHINPGSVLDYALVGQSLKVTAMPNTADATMLGNILSWFDHFPVIYKVEW